MLKYLNWIRFSLHIQSVFILTEKTNSQSYLTIPISHFGFVCRTCKAKNSIYQKVNGYCYWISKWSVLMYALSTLNPDHLCMWELEEWVHQCVELVFHSQQLHVLWRLRSKTDGIPNTGKYKLKMSVWDYFQKCPRKLFSTHTMWRPQHSAEKRSTKNKYHVE